jgi:hypothetical protein
VESTLNWYWLVDGFSDHGYRVRLANPAATEQYGGLKNSDDKSDAFFLAELSRLGIVRKLRARTATTRRGVHRTDTLFRWHDSIGGCFHGGPFLRVLSLEPGKYGSKALGTASSSLHR